MPTTAPSPGMTIRVETTRTEVVDDTFNALQWAHDQVEKTVVEVEKMAGQGEADPGSVPAVTIELVGVVAAIASDVGQHIDELVGFRDRLSLSVPSLSAIRAEQLRQARETDDAEPREEASDAD